MLRLLLLSTLCSLSSITTEFACSCDYQGSFIKMSQYTPLVALVKVSKYLSFKEIYSSKTPMSMEVEIIEIYKGKESRKTVTVWGDNGILCRPYLSEFKEQQYYVIAFGKGGSGRGHTDEKETDYSISICGAFWLTADFGKSTVTGDIDSKNGTSRTIKLAELSSMLEKSQNAFIQKEQNLDKRFITYTVDLKKQNLKFYWKDDKQQNFKSIHNLKTWLEKSNKKLEFAMNGGMYKEDHSPLGLYIEDKKIIRPLNTKTGNGNFYLKPNGVFYITADSTPAICNTTDFINNGKIKYATQSGPMLVIDGKIHPEFKEGSTNLNIRNGVGILPDNRILFAMSKEGINFYDFANYFKSMGCKNALYLDGFVSRTYLPAENWIQTDGDFGAMIGVTTNTKN